MKDKGITLIALVITIVVLIILSAVSINLLLGDNGLIERARIAQMYQVHAEIAECIGLEYLDYEIEKNTQTGTITFLDYLTNKGYINESGVIYTEELLGKQAKLGNGDKNGSIDVYKLEVSGNSYELYYYGSDGNKAFVDIFGEETQKLQESKQEYFTYILDEENRTALITGVSTEYGVFYTESSSSSENITTSGSNIGSGSGTTTTSYPLYILDNGVKVTDIVFPSVIENGEDLYKVTGIGYKAFCFNPETSSEEVKSEFTSFVIPEGVTDISNYAFCGCSSLTSVSIPDSVTNIGNYAFKQCSSLASVTIPKGVTYISGYSFAECTKLKTINIPKSVTIIYDYAFQYTYLQTVNYAGTEEEWGNVTLKIIDNDGIYYAKKNYNVVFTN